MTDEELIARLREISEQLGSPTAWEAATRIEALKAEIARLDAGWQSANVAALTNALERDAATEAAYEAAVQTCDNVTNNTNFTRDIRRTSSYCAERIRILATPDQTAALGKLIAEAEARGKRIGAASEKIARLTEWLKDDEDNIYLLPQDDVMKMRTILAAIPKEGV